MANTDFRVKNGIVVGTNTTNSSTTLVTANVGGSGTSSLNITKYSTGGVTLINNEPSPAANISITIGSTEMLRINSNNSYFNSNIVLGTATNHVWFSANGSSGTDGQALLTGTNGLYWGSATGGADFVTIEENRRFFVSNTGTTITANSDSGAGVYGKSNTWIGVSGESKIGYGVKGEVLSACSVSYGVVGYGNASVGVGATSNYQSGMYSETYACGAYFAVYGAALGANGGNGIGTTTNTGIAFYGTAKTGKLLDLGNTSGSAITGFNNGAVYTSSLFITASGIKFPDESIQTTAAGGSTGTIIMSGSATPPAGHLSCNGSVYTKSTYSSLATALGSIRSNVATYKAPIPGKMFLLNSKLYCSGTGGYAGINIYENASEDTGFTDKSYGGTYVSTDSGATWSKTIKGSAASSLLYYTGNWIFDNMFYTGSRYVGQLSTGPFSAGVGPVFFSSTDGVTFNQTSYGADVSVWDGNNIVTVGVDSGGSSIIGRFSATVTLVGFNYPWPADTSIIDIATDGSGTTVFVGTYLYPAGVNANSSPVIYTSTNGGVTVTSRTVPTGFGTIGGLLSVTYLNGNFVIIDAIGNIAMSNNGGVSWTLIYDNFSSTSKFPRYYDGLSYNGSVGYFNGLSKPRIIYYPGDTYYYYAGYASIDLTNWIPVPFYVGGGKADSSYMYVDGGYSYDPYPYNTSTQFMVPNISGTSGGQYYYIKT